MGKSRYTAKWITLTVFVCCYVPYAAAGTERPDGFTIRGSAGYGYNDNIRFSDENEISDMFTNITVGIEHLLEKKLHSLQTALILRRQMFTDHSDLDNFSQILNMTFKKELTQYSRLRIDENFEHAEDPTSFEEEFGRVSGRFDTYKNKLYFETEKELSAKQTINFRLGNEIKEVERSDLSDSLLNYFGLQWDIEAGPKTYGYIKYDISHRLVDSSDYALIQTLAPGLKRYLTRNLYVSAYGGADIIHTFADNDIVRPTYYAAITDELDKVSTITLAYHKKHITTGYDADIFDQWRNIFEYKRQLTDRLNGDISFFYGEGESLARDIEEKLFGSSIALNYSLTKNWQTNVSYKHVDKDSDETTRTYTNNTAFLSFTFIF